MAPHIPHHLTLRTVLIYLGVFAVIALLVLYVGYQARFILAGPTVAIFTENSVSADRVVAIEGQAKNIVSIDLNGRTIYTDERGYFKETIVLENGYTIATVRAKDRFGRVTALNRSFIYKPLTDNS